MHLEIGLSTAWFLIRKMCLVEQKPDNVLFNFCSCYELIFIVKENGTANYLYTITSASDATFKARAEAITDFDGDGILDTVLTIGDGSITLLGINSGDPACAEFVIYRFHNVVSG